MPTVRDNAMVVRVHPIGEADRIVTLLTREHGVVRAVARGVRKTTSRFGARLEPLNLLDIQWSAGRGNLHTVTQAELMQAYGTVLPADYSRWTIGQAMAETAERLAGEEVATQLFLLLVSAMRALMGEERDPALVLDAFTLRALSVSGWGVSFEECARCNAPGPHKWFAYSNGGALCDEHRLQGAAAPSQETLQLMGALLASDWATADASETKVRREATGLVKAMLQWHLEREIKSLKHVDRDLKGQVRAI